MSTQRASWKVKGEDILHELVSMMNITAEEMTLLGGLSAQARQVAPEMTEAFYERLFKHQNTSEYFEGVLMERLHSMVADWFVELFNGNYDTAYAQKRLGIGKIHVQIGLPVRYPLAMLDVVLPFGERIVQQSPKPAVAATGFRKVLALDVAIFNQAYEDSQLHHLSELIGGESLARLLMSGKV
jgi:hypothetical protein